VALARPHVIKLSKISCSILAQTVCVNRRTLCVFVGLRTPELISSPASDAAAQSTKEVLGLGKVQGLFPGLRIHEEMGIRVETGKTVGHC